MGNNSSNNTHVHGQHGSRILLLGLDSAGKTRICYTLGSNVFRVPDDIPTMPFSGIYVILVEFDILNDSN